jgi:hypothetical protein
MTSSEAEAIALTFVEEKYGRRLEMAAGGRRSPRDANLWIVTFLVTGPNGQRLDGPLMVVVDDQSTRPRFWP